VVPAPADSAVRYGLGIIHSVMSWLDRAQIKEDGFQIFVGHMTEIPPWHDGIELPNAYFTCVHDSQERSFVVITDTGRIRRQIRAGHLREGSVMKSPPLNSRPGSGRRFSSRSVWHH